MVGASAQAFDKEEHETVEQEDNKNDDEELGKFVLNNGDDVVVPAALDDPEETGTFILRGQCQKVHDYGVSLSDALEQNAAVICKMQFWQRNEIEGPPASGDGG